MQEKQGSTPRSSVQWSVWTPTQIITMVLQDKEGVLNPAYARLPGRGNGPEWLGLPLHFCSPLPWPFPLMPLCLPQVFPKPNPFLFFSTQLTQAPFQGELSQRWKSIKKDNEPSGGHRPNFCSCHDSQFHPTCLLVSQNPTHLQPFLPLHLDATPSWKSTPRRHALGKWWVRNGLSTPRLCPQQAQNP